MRPIPLSPIDHVFTGGGAYPVEFVFVYDGLLDEARLRDSLEVTLGNFPPVRSKLVRISERDYGMEPGEDGLVFTAAESSDSYQGLENAYAFLDPVRTMEGEPLARIKLTRTPSGSVLGISISHAVADGFSYFFFLSSWAQTFRRERSPAPVHRRQLLVPGPDERLEKVDPVDLFQDSGIHWGRRRPEVQRDRVRWDRLLLSGESVSELLGEARRDSEGRLSLNDVLSAHLWKTYVPRWDRAGHADRTYLACPVDLRRALRPFPATFFGCAVSLAMADVRYDQLRTASLGKLASRIRSAVSEVNATSAWRGLRTLQTLRHQEGLSTLERCHVIPPSGLLVTNLSRLPVGEIAFDAGPPTAYDILTPAARGAVILPAEDGFDIRVCCPLAA